MRFTSQVPNPVNEDVWSYGPQTAERTVLEKELQTQLSAVHHIPLTIGGQACDGVGAPDNLTCPHDRHHLLAQAQVASSQQVEKAIQSALQARHDWNRLGFYGRAGVFLKAAELLSARYRARINAATMLGQSKTCHQAEIDAACELIDFLRFNVKFAEDIHHATPQTHSRGQWNQTHPRGLEGFVFAVGPFNFTAISVNLAVSPALMGCGVVWKPAPAALWASHVALQVLEEAGLPPGVINLVHGDAADIGRIVLGHPELAGIHFTGSTKTFEHLWSGVGQRLSQYRQYPRLVGETGGKGFIFAHASADPQQLVCALIRGAFEYQGQKCSAASRAFIPASLWACIKEPLLEEIKTIKMGSPCDFKNFMSAVIHAQAFDKITGYIRHAQGSSDAEVVCGGGFDDREGYFIQPTVLLAHRKEYRSLQEEIFGPVLTVFVYPDAHWEEALQECAHGNPYALTGAVFARDRHTIAALTERLEYGAGNFYINDKPTGAVVGQQPFGGSRKSGTNDKAGSVLNLWRWTSVRTIKENFQPVVDYRYPYLS